jgi:L-seryl-tRNA(Ser) seleniumtransferase
MEPEDRQRYLRALPAVDELLRHPQIQTHLKNHSKQLVVGAIRRVLERKRQAILRNPDGQDTGSLETAPESLLAVVAEELAAASRFSLRPVINATGVVLHTNLGRAPLSKGTLKNIVAVATRYSNLEFD